MSQVKKILIIGLSSYKTSDSEVRIDCYSWRKIGKIQNPRDYDTLIISLLSLSNEKQRNQVYWNDVDSKLNVFTCWEILKRKGEIIFIGDPRLRIPSNRGAEKKDSAQEKPFLRWTGLQFDWDNDPGDTVCPGEAIPEFNKYLKRLRNWDFSLRRVSINREVLKQYINFNKLEKTRGELHLNTVTIAQNISENLLIFFVQPIISVGREQPERWGYMTFLPQIDASEDETLEIVLRDICGVTISLPEPQWIHQYVAPGQEAVDKEISDYNGKIEKAKVGLEKSEKERTEVRRPLKLLYGTGIDLQDIVWEVLETLGAKVERPEKPNEDDGCIKVKVGNEVKRGVLEIKSTTSSQFDKSGIRQLGEWIARKTAKNGKRYKGIFIGNDSFDKPIEEREQPFSPDFKKSAEILKFCCMRTEDLCKIYLAKSSGKFDAAAFWSDVFQANGVFPIDKYFSGAIPKGDYSS